MAWQDGTVTVAAVTGLCRWFEPVARPGGRSASIGTVLAVYLICTTPAMAQQNEDPILAQVDSRNQAEAPANASEPGTQLVMATRGDVLTFTVPPHCAAWPVGTNGVELAMTCAKASWPKLNGIVTIRLTRRRSSVPARRLDPEWAGLPPPRGQYRLQAREALVLGDHVGNVEAYCDNNWFYCSEVRVDGDLFGTRTELRFAATTWDGRSAGALGRAIVAASILSDADAEMTTASLRRYGLPWK